jgi:alpha-1,2-glucosyltransferase
MNSLNSATIVFLAILLYEFNRLVPDPYMDEIFHIPQLQRYCENDFSFDSYDRKLTTPPGLYLISRVFHLIFPCDVGFIRLINIAFLFATKAVLSLISKDKQITNLILFPPAFFFYFLYYTDAASTFFILNAYWLMSIDFWTISALV